MKWWEDFFDQEYAHRFLEREVEPDVFQLLELLELGAGSRILDQCCGPGLHSRVLARRGLTPVGVDLCADYIDTARANCPAGEFVCQDAGQFVADPPCDGAFNVYSSFGYSACDRENARLLQAARSSLRPGARLVLETINAANVITNFQPLISHQFADGQVAERVSWLDWERGLLKQNWRIRRPGQADREHATQMRLFLPSELAGLLSACGFEPLRLLGGLQGGPFQRDSPRMLWVARRL
ncbi:MAG: class I SAM-dependent methyltransferase [Vulcanimicrobiota bacterium]